MSVALLAVVAAVVAAAVSAGGCSRPIDGVRMERTRRLMGVPWTITVHAASEAKADAAIEAALAEVARLEGILSDYDPASEVSRLSASSPCTVEVGDDLWRVLEASVRFRDSSGGGFDPTVGPLTTLWRQSRRSGRLPEAGKLAAARAAVGPSTLRLDPEHHTAELRVPGMRIDLGGIGMGYAIDRAMAILAARGIASAMIDASGDIAVSGPPPGRNGWRIAIARVGSHRRGDPASGTLPIELSHAAVTTSGDAFQAVEIDAARYSHIVDPRTGIGVAGPASVTVIARDGTTADAAATAASVLGPVEGAAWLAGIPGATGLFQWIEAGEARELATAGWPGRATTETP